MKKKNSKEAADFPGRFGALTWRPGDLMKNLETPGKTGRVDRYELHLCERPKQNINMTNVCQHNNHRIPNGRPKCSFFSGMAELGGLPMKKK